MLMRGWRLVPLVLLGVAGLSGRMVRAEDGADAKKAVEVFLTAVQAGDDKAMKAAVTEAPEHEAAVTAYLDLMVATSKLQKAAAAKFGASAQATFGTTSGPQLQERLKAVREAPIKLTGTSAILTILAQAATMPADTGTKQAGGTIILVKSEGGWKIDGASLFQLTPENRKKTEKNVALSGKLLPVTRQMMQEINDGKYAAAVDAYQEFWTRSEKAAKELEAAGAATMGAATQGK